MCEAVPLRADGRACSCEPIREQTDQAAIELQLRADSSPARERDVESWHEHLLESIATLELPQGAVASVAVVEHPVRQVRHTPRFAQFDRLCTQSVVRPFVLMAGLGEHLDD